MKELTELTPLIFILKREDNVIKQFIFSRSDEFMIGTPMSSAAPEMLQECVYKYIFRNLAYYRRQWNTVISKLSPLSFFQKGQ